MKKRLLKKYDIIALTVLFVVILISFVLLYTVSKDGSVAVIEQNGQIIQELPLNKDSSYDIKDKDGKITNTLVIKDEEVFMKYADCPDKICVKHKAISKNNESIICLPNKVVVTVRTGSDSEIDGVAG